MPHSTSEGIVFEKGKSAGTAGPPFLSAVIFFRTACDILPRQIVSVLEGGDGQWLLHPRGGKV